MNFMDFAKRDQPLDNRSAWIKEPGIKIYVRRSVHLDCDYDLAVLQANCPGNGALTRFLDTFEPHYKFYVDSVLNDRLVGYLQRRGYVIVDAGPGMMKVRKHNGKNKTARR